MARIKKTNGRRKIEMKKISKESNLKVTFSKRRNGLFKKASELCTLCATEVALIIFSPRQKVFSFGHPNVDYVVNRFLSGAPPQTSGYTRIVEDFGNANLCNLNAELTELSELDDSEKKRSVMLNTLLKPMLEQCWWAGTMEAMNLSQLELLKASMEVLKSTFPLNANSIQFQGFNPPQFLAGSSSTSVALPHQALTPLNQPPILPTDQIFEGNSLMPPLPTSQGLNDLNGFGSRFY
ncbi:hypothetical protein L6164_023531 [Bauhinia variegata]|uniref:Uncharacterized protein n=1 Tax=Bauhinia variegata TaxID=167791 RepID=A0ACB9MIX7_BAUVA|nr:hypothetical protein L6164_023531 [Bauhinia variegata]